MRHRKRPLHPEEKLSPLSVVGSHARCRDVFFLFFEPPQRGVGGRWRHFILPLCGLLATLHPRKGKKS